MSGNDHMMEPSNQISSLEQLMLYHLVQYKSAKNQTYLALIILFTN